MAGNMNSSKGGGQDKLMMCLQRPESEISRRELLKLAVPFGMVEIDNKHCTGCGLCTIDCPTGALAVLPGEGDAYRLVFRHSTCIACGECVKICPEDCLSLQRTFDVDRVNQPAKVLFEDMVIRCSECGSPVASKAMINKLRDKVPAAAQRFHSRFELCPACKIKAQFNRGSSSEERSAVSCSRMQ